MCTLATIENHVLRNIYRNGEIFMIYYYMKRQAIEQYAQHKTNCLDST